MNLVDIAQGHLPGVSADPAGGVAVVAFAGGTGSGKSSLVNVLAGADVAEVGSLRPTTSDVLAVLPGATDAPELLDRIGVLRRAHGRQVGAVLCDLPDIDSIEEGHVRVARAVLDHADAIVWVTDPEKYADAALHRLIAEYDDVPGLLVLSHADRLSGADRLEILDDLARLAPDREILAVAVPPGGLPLGVGELADRIGEFEPLALDHAGRRNVRQVYDALAPLPQPRPLDAWQAAVSTLADAADAVVAAVETWAPNAGARLARLGQRPTHPEFRTVPPVVPPWDEETPVVAHATAEWMDAAESLSETLDGVVAMGATVAIPRRAWWMPVRVVTVTVAVLAVIGALMVPDVDWWWGVVISVVSATVGWVVLGRSGRSAGVAAVAGLGGRVDSMFEATLASEAVTGHLERVRIADQVCSELERLGEENA